MTGSIDNLYGLIYLYSYNIINEKVRGDALYEYLYVIHQNIHTTYTDCYLLCQTYTRLEPQAKASSPLYSLQLPKDGSRHSPFSYVFGELILYYVRVCTVFQL